MSPAISDPKAIFFAALDHTSPAERSRYLDVACGSDPALRSRVERLLGAHDQAGQFLGGPGGAPASGEVPGEGPGTQIGPYKLLQRIGEGGMGIVYMADQKEPIARRVALKIIKPGMDTRHVIARFEAERQALALMDHPNIAKVLDAGTTGEPEASASGLGRPYFVMELVHGVPITQYCDDQRLTPRQRLELFLPVCHAIQHAHQRGIIHRDIKPTNVLVTLYDGQPVPKVIDFGVAKATEQRLTDRTLFTQFGTLVGTLEYMSPEQAEMSALGADTRSDIFSLGVLLYELLTGSTPLSRQRMREAAYAEILRMIKEEEPQRPSTRLSTSGEALVSISAQRQMEPARLTRLLRGDLDWIVMKALEKDRNRRYDSASGFAADVQRYLDDEAVSARPPSAAYRFQKFARKNRIVMTTVALVAAALLLGIAISTWQAIRATHAEADARQGWAGESAERRRAEKEERLAKQRLFDARVAQARAGRKSGLVGQRIDGLKAITEAAGLATELELGPEARSSLRHEAIACLGLTDLDLARQWQGWSAEFGDWPAFDAELRHYTRSDLHGQVTVHPVGETRDLARVGDAARGSYQHVTFSPAGDLLALASQTLAVWDWRRQSVVWRCPSKDFITSAVAFHPIQRRVAFGLRDGTVGIFDLDSQEQVQLDLDATAFRLAFSPDGKQLAVACHSAKQVQIHDAESGQLLRQWSEPAGPWGVAWHPQGQLLAVWTGDFHIHVWNSETFVEQAVLRGHEQPVVLAGFLPAGDRLWTWSWDGTTRLWDIWSGQELVRAAATNAQPSQDGTKLIGRRGSQFLLWNVAGGAEYRTLPGWEFTSNQTAEPQNLGGHLSPDGRLLAIGGTTGIRLLDLVHGRNVAVLPTGPSGAWFHPAGSELLTFANNSYRWPLRSPQAESQRLDQEIWRLGPPLKIGQPATGYALDQQGGRMILGRINPGALVIDLVEPVRPPRRLRHPGAIHVGLSPDGRWAATGAHNVLGAKVWDAESGQLIRDLHAEPINTTVAFRPDGKQLATCNHREIIFWETGSWKEERRITLNGEAQPAIAWDRHSKLLAFTPSRYYVELHDPVAGRKLTTLEAPDGLQVAALVLTPDGDRLIVWSGRPSHIRVWDLRQLRSSLAPMGLDWDAPPYDPPAPLADSPLRIEVDLGELEKKSET